MTNDVWQVKCPYNKGDRVWIIEGDDTDIFDVFEVVVVEGFNWGITWIFYNFNTPQRRNTDFYEAQLRDVFPTREAAYDRVIQNIDERIKEYQKLRKQKIEERG